MITWQELNRVAADILAITNEHKQIVIDHTLQPMLDSAELLRSHGLLGYVGNPDSQVEGATVFEITWEGRAFYSQWGNPDITTQDNELLRLAKAVTDHMEIEYRSSPLKGDFVQTKLAAYLNMGDTTYAYSSDVGGADVVKAIVKLKQYIANLEQVG